MRHIAYKNRTILSSLSDARAIAVLQGTTIGEPGGFVGSLCFQWREWRRLSVGQAFWAHKIALEYLLSVISQLKTYATKYNSPPSLAIREIIVMHNPSDDIANLSGVGDELAKDLVFWGKLLQADRALNHIQDLQSEKSHFSPEPQ